MAEISKKTKNTEKTAKTVLTKIEEISETVNKEDVHTILGALEKEIGDRKLNKEEIEQLQEIMSVDALEAVKWKKVTDVLKYISIFAIAESNPEGIRKLAEMIIGVVGIFYPAINVANGFLALVPERLFSALVKIGGLATPEYLIYKGANMIASQKAKKVKEQAESDADAQENMINLIIVCKNKLLTTEMSKLINKEDDVDEETVIGTKDGTVHPVIWNEAAWEAFRDKLTSKDKVLIIGKVKNTMPLTAEQVRFEKYGVKYGWNNNIAKVEADPKVLSKAKDYKEFLSDMDRLQIADKLKKNAKLKFDWGTAAKLAIFPPLLLGDILLEDTAVREQQLLFGLYNLYMQDLMAFLAPKEA